MALRISTIIVLTLPYFFAPAHSQGPFSYPDVGSNCVGGSTTLADCSSWFSGIGNCGLPGETAITANPSSYASVYSSCVCQPTLVESASNCASQVATCLSSSANLYDPLFRSISQFCGAAQVTGPAVTVSGPSTSTSTTAQTPNTNQSSASTSNPNPGASSTQSQVSPTASGNSSGSVLKPFGTLLLLSIGIATAPVFL